MTKKNFEDRVTADGTFSFPAGTPGRDQVVEVSGSFGGGTVVLGYVTGSGAFNAYEDTAGDDISTTAEQSWVVTLPPSGRIAITVTGSTTPSLTVTSISRR